MKGAFQNLPVPNQYLLWSQHINRNDVLQYTVFGYAPLFSLTTAKVSRPSLSVWQTVSHGALIFADTA
jgi:hypothetical protein